MHSKLKHAPKLLLLVLMGTVVGLLAAEIGLRLVGFEYLRQELLDRDLGLVQRPGARGWYRKEGEAYVQISSAGLRDREHAKKKPPGVLRIAVLGDSYAEALQVPLEETFWWVMGQKLKPCPVFSGRNIEVLNFGVSGYGTAQELLTLRKRVWQYAPDIVLLAFLTGNDIRDNSPELSRNYPRPYFTLRRGKLVLDASFSEGAYYKSRTTAARLRMDSLIDRSRVLQTLSKAKSDYLAWKQARQLAGTSPPVRGGEIGLDDHIYFPPTDKAWENAWRVTESLLVQMNEEVRQRGAVFVVATLSNGIQAHPDPVTRGEFMKWLGVKDLFYPDRRIRDAGRREGFLVVTLAPALQAFAQRRHVYLHGFPNTSPGVGHWNGEGHRLAGTLIAEKLCKEMQRTTPLLNKQDLRKKLSECPSGRSEESVFDPFRLYP